jgi:catechol 2,3-dioxygenase-like lactoylglutathione lyase family enzyme
VHRRSLSPVRGRVLQVSTPIATFKELCLDTHPAPGQDPTEIGRFWAAALGCEYVRGDTRYPGDVVGTEEGQGVAICPVPEPKTVKHRVHPDISVRDLSEVLDLGATVIRPQDDEIRWTVMADPEGGEFCAFVQPPERLAPYRLFEFNVDCVDAEASARWWADVFGVEAEPKDGYWWFTGAPGFPSSAVSPFFAMVFGNVPEPKTVKNRWHWDVYGDVDDLLSRGATMLWEMPGWTVLADPEGNEFCVFAPR